MPPCVALPLPLLPLLLSLLLAPVRSSEIELRGNDSYLEFPPFESCPAGGFTFEFRPNITHALLLYTEDLVNNLYIECTLLGTELKLTVNLVPTSVFRQPIVLKLNVSLDRPQKWQSLRFTIEADRLRLQLDDAVTSHPLARDDKPFDGFFRRPIFFGGLPLAPAPDDRGSSAPALEEKAPSTGPILWTAPYQPRYAGSVRNLALVNCTTGRSQLAQLLGGVGTQFQGRDWCQKALPSAAPMCLNSGLCTNTDYGPRCDCRGTGYKGRRCEELEATSVATLDGQSYISMTVQKQTIYSSREFISLHIKTRQSDGFLLHTGNQITGVHMAVYLKAGRLHLTIRSGHETHSNKDPINCPKGLFQRFDDNQWHAVNVTWLKREIMVEADGIPVYQQDTVRSDKLLSSRVLCVGGYQRNSLWEFKDITKSGIGFFKGCMRKVFYNPETIRFDLIKMARIKKAPVSYQGDVKFDKCHDLFAAEPITFHTNEAFLRVKSNWRSTRRWSLGFQFKTIEEGGLMLYQKGNGSNADFLAFELRRSELYLLLNAGSGTKKYNAAWRNVTDGKAHRVRLTYIGGKGTVVLDGRTTHSFDLNKNSNRGFREMNMNEHIFVGGLPAEEQLLAPHELWSAKLRRGYVGCFWDLQVDRHQVDLVYETRVRRKDVGGAISLRCTEFRNGRINDPCPMAPCLHAGICQPGWDRFICDCSATMWTGDKCERRAPILQFNGYQRMVIQLPQELQSEAEDVVLRFKTKEATGLLFGTHSPLSSAKDRMELLIQKRKLVLILNFGKGNKTKVINRAISDNMWHTVSIHRRALQVTLNLDNEEDIAFDIVRQKSGKLINMRNIVIGQYVEPGQRLGNHFIGNMMHFSFNGVNYFELARNTSPANIEVTADLSADQDIKRYPISFLRQDAYITLDSLHIHRDFKLHFWFRTERKDGVLLFNDGNGGGDYVLMELVAGSLHFAFQAGSAVNRLTSPTASLQDGRWHEVSLKRSRDASRNDIFVFRVDGQPRGIKAPVPTSATSAYSDNPFRLGNPLFVGGVENGRQATAAKAGFIGCIADLFVGRLDGRLTNPLAEASIPVRFRQDVVARCPSAGIQCRPGICYYGGACIQQWRRVRCNCDLTSFMGPQCQQVSSTVLFGPTRGHVELEMLDRVRNTRRDELAFGVQTQSADVTLVHIVGQGSKGFDFIRVDILPNGYVQISYDMGSSEHQVTEDRQRVNDGRYHIIRLVREGPNTVLKVDNLKVQKIPSGPQQSSHFTRQKWIFLGTLRPSGKRLTRRSNSGWPYEGVISGMVFNGIPVTDLIVGRTHNPHIAVRLKGSVVGKTNFVPNLHDFPPPLTNLTDSPSDTSASTMQSTAGDKRPGPALLPNSSRGIVSPRTECGSNSGRDCRVTDASGNALIIPTLKISSTPAKHDSNSRTTPSPSSVNVPPPPSRAPAQRPTPSPAGLGNLNIWLIVAIACGGALVLLLVVCIIYRCRHKADEGSYSVEHHQREFGGDPACKPLRRVPGEGEPLHMNGSAATMDSVIGATDASVGTFSLGDRCSTPSDRKKKKKKAKPGRKETREWYV